MLTPDKNKHSIRNKNTMLHTISQASLDHFVWVGMSRIRSQPDWSENLAPVKMITRCSQNW